MTTKHEWKKQEKVLYGPPVSPVEITVPPLNYYTISGQGDPNEAFFAEYISALYTASYAVKMSPRQGISLAGYTAYTVYPLEGVWDLNEQGRTEWKQGKLNKKHLVFTLMIRQPDFLTAEAAEEILAYTGKEKSLPLADSISFCTIEEGLCVQMLHIGSFDDEPASFERMEAFAADRGLNRLSHIHREIYLSDPRRTNSDRLRTILRFRVSE